MSLDDFLNKKLGKVPQKIPQKIIPKTVKNKEKKELLIKYILAINKGHKEYEKYNFKSNHQFLAHITQMVYDL